MANTICLTRDMENTLLDAATGTGAGTAFAVPSLPQSGRFSTFVMQVETAGTFSGLTVLLEGSVDNSKWGTIVTSTSLTGGLTYAGFYPVNFVRANVTVFSGGTSVTVKLQLGGN